MKGDRTAVINHELAVVSSIGYSPIGYTPFLVPERLAWRESVRRDLALLRKTWDGLITYGMLDHLAEVPGIAAETGFERLLLGVYDVSSGEEIEAALEAARRHPEMIRSICLGNEGLLFRRYDLDRLQKTFARFRKELPGVLLTTSEPIFSWGDRRLLRLVDFCAPIIHPWIHCENLKSDPVAAAHWVIQAAQRLQLLSKKPVLIKETGFPADRGRYPEEHQAEFWETMLREFGALTRGVHLASFEAFDNPKKITFSAPRRWDNHWGIFDERRRPKPAYQAFRRHLLPPRAAPAPRATVAERDAVSVVISGTRARHLSEAIESVLEQRRWLKKLVLVDDNSKTDDIRSIWRKYRAFPGMEYVRRTKPGSAGTARNAGFKRVDSKYVCFLDDDDLFLPGKLEAQKRTLDARPGAAGVSAAAKVIDADGRVIGRSGQPSYFPGAPLASMLAFCCFVSSSVMVRSAAVRRHGDYLEFFKGEDWELWCRYLRAGLIFESLQNPLVGYRRHDNNVSTHSYVREAAGNILKIYMSMNPEELVAPLRYDPRSGDLIKAGISIMHADYAGALAHLDSSRLPATRIARYICYRELERYRAAMADIAPLCRAPELAATAARRLETHRVRFPERRRGLLVGSAALLLEQRLLARDVLAAATFSERVPDIEQYFAPNPANINIEDGSSDMTEDIFFSRVSLTSC